MYRRDVRSVRRTTAAVRTQAGPVWPDPIDGLKGVYGAHVTRDIALRLTERAATAYLERDPELHRSTSCAAGSRTCCSSRAWWAIPRTPTGSRTTPCPLTFQHNPVTGDRRISGTMASLVCLASAESPHEVDPAIGRFMLRRH